MAKVEGRVVKVDDYVGFKYDHEKSGKIVSIKGPWLGIEAENDMTGEAERYDKHQDDCWLED